MVEILTRVIDSGDILLKPVLYDWVAVGKNSTCSGVVLMDPSHKFDLDLTVFAFQFSRCSGHLSHMIIQAIYSESHMCCSSA